ncbi:hypothetical protein L1987_32708 [Smallanthus sonchifolius]|uniref:Uncharacterized protein n=1 Tax=Smallanthus sonchifolius TaxID=185202 RepID=A0ACB9HPN9_9ASTR|nr:hypothetical protein L1987_32708 [Smallanthus sonchifolius]
MTKVVASLQAILELQLKFDNSAKPSGIMGFTWKIPMYRPAVTIKNSDLLGTSSSTHQSEDIILQGVKEFTYDELKLATKNFQDKCLEKWTDKEVYKGWVHKLTYSPSKRRSGLPVVVKRIHHYSYFDRQMLKECSHPNIVKLIGYCMEAEQLFLVYEFMHNGNFDEILSSGVVARLPLVKKVQIAFGVARGILFLQKMHCYFGTDKMIKPMFERRDIMLDKDFLAKLSDYGVTDYLSYYELYLIFKPVFEERHIMTDKDFLAKLSAFGVTNVHDYYKFYPILKPVFEKRDKVLTADVTEKISYYIVAYESSRSPPRELLQMDLSGFTVIFAEVLTGRRILNESELDTIDDKFLQDGKMSLRDIARSCFEGCYDKESESKMLEMLEEGVQYIPACQDETFYTANLDETFFSGSLEEREDEMFYTANLDERKDEAFFSGTLEEREDY